MYGGVGELEGTSESRADALLVLVEEVGEKGWMGILDTRNSTEPKKSKEEIKRGERKRSKMKYCLDPVFCKRWLYIECTKTNNAYNLLIQ